MPFAPRPLHAAALAGALLVGCAHAPAPQGASGAAPATEPASALVTGSRLPQRVDPATGKATAFTAVRTYTRADLDRTGMPDLATQLPAAVGTPR